MAVHKPAPRPVPTQPRRANLAPAPAPSPGKVRVGGTIGERRVLDAQPKTVQESAPRSSLQRARDVFTGHKVAQIRHQAKAKYVTGRPESPLKAITKDFPNVSNSNLIPSSRAVHFLDSFLASSGKIRSKA